MTLLSAIMIGISGWLLHQCPKRVVMWVAFVGTLGLILWSLWQD